VPSLKIAFDIGRCPQRAVHMEHLFLSHCHLDHVGGAGAYAATRSMLALPPPAVFVPAASAPALEVRAAVLRSALRDSSDVGA
jgi:ribonuclease Z